MTSARRYAGFGRLLGYYAVTIAALIAVAEFVPSAVDLLPIDGRQLHIREPAPPAPAVEALQEAPRPAPLAAEGRVRVALAMLVHMLGTLALMLPVTRVYMAINRGTHDQGFVAALMVAPICVTGVVLLIQDSLPLAFGLAALVAAVRFQIPLRNALDGIFVFAAICVALSSGVGYIGVAIVISAVFCLTCLAIFESGYGAPPARPDPNQTETRPGPDDLAGAPLQN